MIKLKLIWSTLAVNLRNSSNILSLILGLILLSFTGYCQRLEQVSVSNDLKNSIYDATELTADIIWICGENGLLQQCSNGKYSDIDYPSLGINLLKFHRKGNSLFIAADNGVLYSYSIVSKIWKVYRFENFKKQCFYDLYNNANGELFICGGASKISIGELALPKGFLLKVTDLESLEYETIYSSKLKFVWSVFEDSDGNLKFSNYNGFKSKVFALDVENGTQKKTHVVRGLVYDHFNVGESTFFYGSKSFRYTKDGLVGKYHANQKQPSFTNELENSGFVTDMFTDGHYTYASTFNGYLYKIENEITKPINNNKHFSIYSSVSTENGILLVGHGGGILKLVD